MRIGGAPQPRRTSGFWWTQNGGNLHLLQHVHEVLGHCDVRRAFGRAPHVLTAGTSAISIFNEKLQLDLLFWGEIVPLHSENSELLIPAHSENPKEVWGAFATLRSGIFGPSKCIRMDEGGEWKNEVWADFCSGRQIKLLFQGVGARP